MAISRILSPEFLRIDDHLSQSHFAEPPARACRADVMRRYPRIDGPAVLPLFCLAPHGVFRAARITSRAVSSYLAFSPLPALLSKNRRCLFCDTFRRRNFTTAAPACSTRHAAVWCSDFPPASLTTHQRSSAIGEESTTIRKAGKPDDESIMPCFQLFGAN